MVSYQFLMIARMSSADTQPENHRWNGLKPIFRFQAASSSPAAANSSRLTMM